MLLPSCIISPCTLTHTENSCQFLRLVHVGTLNTMLMKKISRQNSEEKNLFSSCHGLSSGLGSESVSDSKNKSGAQRLGKI